jgi:hypothetical protein
VGEDHSYTKYSFRTCVKITILQKLAPFSHLPGTCCLIPNSSWVVQAFPTLLKFENCITGEKREEVLPWKGPIKDFTVQQDLERGCVRIFGHTAQGYRLHTIQEGKPPSRLEKLSLGMHKALDWEMVKRRCNMAEILPVWFRLGQLVPPSGQAWLPPDLKGVFQTYFHGLFTPRLVDEDHLGIFPPDRKIAEDRLALLREGYLAIRAQFFQKREGVYIFLPAVAAEFHSGRFLSEAVDFEWSKKSLQKIVLRSTAACEIVMQLPKPLKSFRMRASLKEKGERFFCDRPLVLQANATLFCDRFEK